VIYFEHDASGVSNMLLTEFNINTTKRFGGKMVGLAEDAIRKLQPTSFAH
jgi:hypothetical protein